jgi:hypothetical protein
MNWVVFAIIAWVALGLELSLRKFLALGGTPIAPSFMLCVLTIIAAYAPMGRVLWLAWALGVAIDLTFVLPMRSGLDARVLGPYAISFVIGAYAMISLRSLLYKRSPFAMGFLAFVGCLITQACVVAILTLRSWWLDDMAWNLWYELWTRMAGSVYTGVLMTVLAPLTPLLQRWLRLNLNPMVIAGTAARM